MFVGGAVGAVCRAGLGELLTTTPTAWPWHTFLANVAGACLLGAVNERLRERAATSLPGALTGAGFCGALTTFSTLPWEVVAMAEAGAATLAVTYIAATVVAGLAAVDGGARWARRGRV